VPGGDRGCGVIRDAVFSLCGQYRYSLTRRWLLGQGHALWVMLNPSTADAMVDDPTVRRLIGFSQAFGLAGLTVVNLFAFRATDPRELADAEDPVGSGNDAAIRAALDAGPDLVVAGWGSGSSRAGVSGRVEAVVEILAAAGPVHHLGLTKDGHPRHPLYLRACTTPEAWAQTPGASNSHG